MRFNFLIATTVAVGIGSLVFISRTNGEVLYTNGTTLGGCYRMDVSGGHVTTCSNTPYTAQSDPFTGYGTVAYTIPTGRTATRMCWQSPYSLFYDTGIGGGSYIGLDIGGDPSPARIYIGGNKACEDGLSFSGSGTLSLTRFSSMVGASTNALWQLNSSNVPVFTLEDSTSTLSIVSPHNGQIFTDESSVPIYGTCKTTPSVAIFNGSTIPSSTEAFYSQPTCTDNTWSTGHFFNQTTESGQWNVLATTTSETAISFFRISVAAPLLPSTLTDFNLDWSCPIAYFSSYDPCNDIGNLISLALNDLRNTIYTTAYKLATATRPFSYVPQIGVQLTNDLISPSTTIDLIPQVPFTYAESMTPSSTVHTVALPGIQRSTWDAVPTDTKTIFRTLSTLVIGVFFLVYLWKRIFTIL